MNCTDSEVGVIERLVLKHARDAFVGDRSTALEWRRLGYTGRPDYGRAIDEYDEFVALLESFGIEILFLSRNASVGLDSIYVRDTSIGCAEGIVLCKMGKRARREEPSALEMDLSTRGVRIVGRIEGSGTVEGGDVVWLDRQVLAVGRGYRTNDEGIRQLGNVLRNSIRELIVVPLPHWRGPSDVFHLMSVLSPIDLDLALVYSPLLPVPFREKLLARGIELVEVPSDEFETMGCNVLTVAPRECVVLSGNPATRRRLESAGVEVHEFAGQEICVKGAGGPTCLTRPIARRAM